MTKLLSRTPVLATAATAVLLSTALAVPAGASAKTYRATVTDPTGDGPAPGRDITEVKLRYRTSGSVLFVITLAGPIDPAGADAGVGVSLGSTCKKLLLVGAGAFSQPDPVAFLKATGSKKPKARQGKGEITDNVYTLSAKHSSFKNLKPGCLAVALVDPATADSDNPVTLDETDEIKFK